jgi:hypothetical protein
VSSPQRLLKRGALVAAANWPTVIVQASADAIFKVVVAVPVVGGIVLAGLVIGAEPPTLLNLDVRELTATIMGLLTARPATLAAFVAAVATAVIGASTFAFVVKAGTVATIVASERRAGAIEVPPLQTSQVTAVSTFSIEQFTEDLRRFGPRFVRLGCGLLVVYVLSAAAFLDVVFQDRLGAAVVAAVTMVFVAWITAVNLFYMLAQVAIVADDCGVGVACLRVGGLLSRAGPLVGRVCGFVLAIIAGATIASLLATAALGFVGFVPFFWFAVVPLQLVAWVLRGLVFQYITIGAVGTYASIYRLPGPETRSATHQPLATAAPVAGARDQGSVPEAR